MSTVERSKTRTSIPLVAGQRLDQPTFHERYEAMPPDTRAELVGGVVYMPSPMRLDHGGTSRTVSGWLFHYQLHTSGVEGADAATVKLDPNSSVRVVGDLKVDMPQPSKRQLQEEARPEVMSCPLPATRYLRAFLTVQERSTLVGI